MKLIVAFVHSAQASHVVRVLERAGLFLLALSRVHGVVHPDEPIVRADLGAEGGPEVRLEAYCEDGRVEHVVALIQETARVGDFPSGAVFVHPVEHAAGIRTTRPLAR